MAKPPSIKCQLALLRLRCAKTVRSTSRIGFATCYYLESSRIGLIGPSLRRNRLLDEVTKHQTIQEARKSARGRFQEQFERTFAYELFIPMRKYQMGRFELLKDACWNFRCEETRTQMRGARARRALSLLERLKKEFPAGR